jgi:hypothetical protein
VRHADLIGQDRRRPPLSAVSGTSGAQGWRFGRLERLVAAVLTPSKIYDHERRYLSATTCQYRTSAAEPILDIWAYATATGPITDLAGPCPKSHFLHQPVTRAAARSGISFQWPVPSRITAAPVTPSPPQSSETLMKSPQSCGKSPNDWESNTKAARTQPLTSGHRCRRVSSGNWVAVTPGQVWFVEGVAGVGVAGCLFRVVGWVCGGGGGVGFVPGRTI